MAGKPESEKEGAEGFTAQRKADRPEGTRDPHEQAREDGRTVSPAGTHAKPSLTDYEKTPGTGALPDEANPNETDPGAG